jgi:hypothetical protein
MFELQFEEQYTLISITESEFTSDLVEGLKETIEQNSDEGNKNFIIDLSEFQHITLGALPSFSYMNAEIVNKGGILVIASPPEGFGDKLGLLNIVSVPTVDEAIDYVFMEEIHNTFWADDEEE